MSNDVVISKELRDRICNSSPCPTAEDYQELRNAPEVANIPEVDEMVSVLDDALDHLYRRGFYEHSDGLGNQLEEGQWDRLKMALETAKKVSSLIHLMEENQMASNYSETPNSSSVFILLKKIKSILDEKRRGAGKYQIVVMDLRLLLWENRSSFEIQGVKE